MVRTLGRTFTWENCMKDISEAVSVSKTVKRLPEKDVQKQCVDWARARGYWARKFSSMTQNSVPDYLFAAFGPTDEDTVCGPVKIKFACEFKAPRKKSTPAQVDEQEAMRLAGWYVFECDNFERFKATVLAYEAEQIA